MIEFKQIIGRGTRLFEGKEFFTVYDFVNASEMFSDPEWDGEPIETDFSPDGKTFTICSVCNQKPCICEKEIKTCEKCGEAPCICIKKVKIKLKDGKERKIQHMISTSFWSLDGKPISAEEFLNNLFGELPNLFKNEKELRTLWSNPMTRKTLLEKLSDAGFGGDELSSLKKLIDAEKSDLFDVLEYVLNPDIEPITREKRVFNTKNNIYALLSNKEKEFIEFALSKYIEIGVSELDREKLSILIKNKYETFEDAMKELGDIGNINSLFIDFQKYLYEINDTIS